MWNALQIFQYLNVSRSLTTPSTMFSVFNGTICGSALFASQHLVQHLCALHLRKTYILAIRTPWQVLVNYLTCDLNWGNGAMYILAQLRESMDVSKWGSWNSVSWEILRFKWHNYFVHCCRFSANTPSVRKLFEDIVQLQIVNNNIDGWQMCKIALQCTGTSV